MKTSEIRKKFLDFFKSKNHSVIESDSLVPKDDPTVLFTTAGMQQFKRQFLGHVDSYTCATTSQKCLRTDDLEEVGRTDFHHTFFEMLGNFSFGDYFKKEAIEWAWEFLTKIVKISPEKLWVSVYKDDDEAANIWLNEIKISKDKLVRLGDKSNFWPANAKVNGPNGPCGPCSEIFFDYGENKECVSAVCDPACDCGRFSEVWNLVFTQFERKDGGVLEPLPNKNIDTGMGLERLASVLQGKKNNFDIDLFVPIMASIKENISELQTYASRVIADHMRAVTFGISDGVIPSNEGRGYIMKKLIITCSDLAIQAGNTAPCIYKVIPSVSTAMSDQYPEIVEKKETTSEMIKRVEEAYIKIRSQRLPELNTKITNLIKNQKDKVQLEQEIGALIFEYKDTHGLTLDTIENEVTNKLIAYGQISTDSVSKAYEIYNKLMEEQQVRSRESSKMTGDVFTQTDLTLNVPKTEFVGYESTQTQANILKLLKDNQEVQIVSKGDSILIILDKTPFYAESGGQVGDTGIIETASGQIKVNDTQKLDDVYIHTGVVEKGTFSIKESVTAVIDTDRRQSIMCNHTATHLLQSALRNVLGSHVGQQGSLVDENRLRFDFTQPKPISQDEITAIEDYVNKTVSEENAVVVQKLKLEEAKKIGALAFFAEKYGQEVRVVSIGDISKEFCGGTHVKNTSEIQLFKVVSQSSVAQGIRRIEAKTAKDAKLYLKEKQEETDKQNDLTKEKQLQEEQAKEQWAALAKTIANDLKSSSTTGKTTIFVKTIEKTDVNSLKRVADLVKQSMSSSVSLLGTQNNGNTSVVVGVTDDLVSRGLSANDLIKQIAPLMSGSGGGRPQLAQAGSRENIDLKKVIEQANALIQEKIKI